MCMSRLLALPPSTSFSSCWPFLKIVSALPLRLFISIKWVALGYPETYLKARIRQSATELDATKSLFTSRRSQWWRGINGQDKASWLPRQESDSQSYGYFESAALQLEAEWLKVAKLGRRAEWKSRLARKLVTLPGLESPDTQYFRLLSAASIPDKYR